MSEKKLLHFENLIAIFIVLFILVGVAIYYFNKETYNEVYFKNDIAQLPGLTIECLPSESLCHNWVRQRQLLTLHHIQQIKISVILNNLWYYFRVQFPEKGRYKVISSQIFKGIVPPPVTLTCSYATKYDNTKETPVDCKKIPPIETSLTSLSI